MIERARRGQPRCREVRDRDSGRAERGARARSERGDHGVRAGLRRHSRIAADEGGRIAVDPRDRGADVAATQIDAEVKGAQTLGSRPATSGMFSADASVPKTCCCAAL